MHGHLSRLIISSAQTGVSESISGTGPVGCHSLPFLLSFMWNGPGFILEQYADGACTSIVEETVADGENTCFSPNSGNFEDLGYRVV